MDYLIVFLGGAMVGAFIALAGAIRRNPTDNKQMRKCARCSEMKPWGQHLINFCDECVRKNLEEHTGTTNPYANGEAERAKYRPRTMWGPQGEDQGR